MNMVRIAHLSDTHLGFRQYNMEERENDVYEAFREAIECVIEERADVLVLAGDTFDAASPPVKALHVFKEALREIDARRSGMNVLAVLGDHDIPKRRGMPPHRLFDVRLLGVHGMEWTEVKGVLFGGISNLKGKYTKALKSEISKFEKVAGEFKGASVLIAHQAVHRFLPFEGAYELHENDLPKNINYYAFGHIHARTSMRFGNGIFAYSGSTEIMRRDEIASWRKNGKGFYIVDLNGKKDEPSLHTINLKTVNLKSIRPQIEIEIGEKDVDNIHIPGGGKLPILHLTVIGDRQMNRHKIMETLDKTLKERVLRCRYAFKEHEAGENIQLSDEMLNIRDIFAAFLPDTLVELAESLFRPLSNDNIEDAIRIAEDFFEERWMKNEGGRQHERCCMQPDASESSKLRSQGDRRTSAAGRRARVRMKRKKHDETVLRMWWSDDD